MSEGLKATAGAVPGERPTYRKLGPEVWVLGGLMVAIGIVTAFLIWTRGLKGSESYLYLVFYAIPANTAISLFPHEPVVIYFGQFADIWITGAAALAGTLVAGWMDHTVFVPMLNLEGRQDYKDNRFYRKAAGLFTRYPFATLVVAGATPIPFWPFKFLSFSVHYPLRRYLAALAVGRYPRYVVLAWAGMVIPIPKWLLVALFLGILLTYAVKAGPGVVRRLRGRAPEGDDGGEAGVGAGRADGKGDGDVGRRESAGDDGRPRARTAGQRRS